MSVEELRLWSTLLILAATVSLGLVPLIESYLVWRDDRKAGFQLRYFEIRRSIDQATMIWELSRLFASHHAIMNALPVDQASKSVNYDNYRYCISAAEGFAFNAAYGFVETDRERAESDKEWGRRREDGNDVEVLRDAYLRNQVRATERGSEIIREIRRLDSIVSRGRITRLTLVLLGLVLNVMGLAAGLRAGLA